MTHRLALSTLGLPGMPMPDVARLASAAGYQGVELRAHPEEPVHPGIGKPERAAARAEFEALGIEILTVAGYAKVTTPLTPQELPELVALAHDLGASYVRVFPGGDGTPEADARAVQQLTRAAQLAEDSNVRILLETHDSHRTGAAAATLLDRVDRKGIGALWDVMHTWLGGETPAESYAHLAPHLGYTQVKDIASAEDTTPLPLGTGALPLGDCLAQLPPDAWLCWEYEKRWYPDAAPLPGLLAAGRAYLTALSET
ncbi:sugar phosphate isomerase/epimerase family protein [Streptomyces sp. NPDC059819]|uniref:sugar phosphate isomerase/epimerase family protein n=1 Tax=Streptomyces sp. NPDC059819 TaxID=3346963 RepID=UPI00364C2C0A